MKGYDSLKQYINDYQLYLVAKEIDPGREQQPTLIKFFEQRMKDRFAKGTRRFKQLLKKNDFTEEDIKILAVHQSTGRVYSLSQFTQKCYGRHANKKHYKKILVSNVFRKGLLKKVNSILPSRVENKRELRQFIKHSEDMNDDELRTIMNVLGPSQWRSWLNELVEKGQVRKTYGVWR